MISKKIYLSGSVRSSTDDSTKMTFEDICKSLAKQLAEQGYTLLIHTNDEHKAAQYALDGLVENGQKPSVEVIEGSDYMRFKENESYQEKLDLKRRRIVGTKQAVLIEAINEADLIVLVGGGSNSSLIGQLGAYLGKSVLPLPGFGGISEGLWNGFRNDNTYSNETVNHIEEDNTSPRHQESTSI